MRYFLTFLTFLFISNPLFGVADAKDDALALPSGINVDQTEESVKKKRKQYTYQDVNFETIAPLYWGLGRLDINNHDHIDNFLRLTKCDIYDDYSQNEFQWGDVKKATQAYLQDRIDNNKFDYRYQFVQPIKLGDYDVKSGNFYIQEKYQINGIRRFEVSVEPLGKEVCGNLYGFEGYPRSILMEFSRPVGLVKFPVNKEIAMSYISQKQENFQRIDKIYRSKKRLYGMRNAYLLIKVRVISSQGDIRLDDGSHHAQAFAALEGIEVYADQELEYPMYKKSFLRDRKLSPMEQRLRKEYKEKVQKKLNEDLKSIQKDSPEKP